MLKFYPGLSSMREKDDTKTEKQKEKTKGQVEKYKQVALIWFCFVFAIILFIDSPYVLCYMTFLLPSKIESHYNCKSKIKTIITFWFVRWIMLRRFPICRKYRVIFRWFVCFRVICELWNISCLFIIYMGKFSSRWLEM